ncbi:class I SAM-dependent methyltransferase [Aeromonas dhakensis]|uniref:class I SAM-dependent methyltransferase n=1 Tax=Aeromonas dhakensis TaxID=196024 RepID=UPI003B9F751A
MNENNYHISIMHDTASYYDSKIIAHGETAKGVDWNSTDSQRLRFWQLAKVINTTPQVAFSLADLGCGYGALYDFLKENYDYFSYSGFDISEEMIKHAVNRYSCVDNAQFFTSSQICEPVDYVVASGIFNVKQSYQDSQWFEYIISVLDHMYNASHFGFSFNLLTSYADPPKMKSYLYYADPCIMFDLCKKRFSKNIALLHDYELYEFTIIVRK